MQTKMMAYDRVITELNAARLRGNSYPIIHSLIEAAMSLSADVSIWFFHFDPIRLITISSQSRFKWLKISMHSPKSHLNHQRFRPSSMPVHTFSTPPFLNENMQDLI
jgi:hypothetical protein